MEAKVLKDLAQELFLAEVGAAAVLPLTERFPELTIADAYAIQMETVAAKRVGGRRVVGKKIGLTSKAMQNLLGVGEPDYGHLFHDMVIPEGDAISRSSLVQPKVEGEIAFLLKRDLAGPGLTAVDVLAATEGVMAALEIVDSRVSDWKIRIQDTVADNASSGRLVLGPKILPISDLDLRLVGMVFEKNGEITGTATGAAVLGHPANAVAWLANKLAELGSGLKSGEIVLSGALTAAPPAAAGDSFRATFDRLGSIGVRFI